MIRNTKKDLEDHLEEINSKLQSSARQAAPALQWMWNDFRTNGTLPSSASKFVLRECSDKLSDTLYRLRAHGEDTKSRLLAGQAIQEPGSILSPRSEARKLASEFDSTRQCLAICSDASERASSGKVHVLDDITVGKDGKQMLIATLGELFNARRVKIGEGAVQIVASSSDASFILGQLSRLEQCYSYN